jgi:hypothetical protein
VPQRQLRHSFRLDIQDRARRLKKEPRAEQQEKLEKMRQFLSNQLGIIDTLWQRSGGLGGCLNPSTDVNDSAAFDNLDDDGAPDGVDAEISGVVPNSADRYQPDQDAAIQGYDEYFGSGGKFDKVVAALPELRILPIPSNMDCPDDHHREVEIRLRRRQADALLTSLRELIADKSFHYSNILRLTKGQSMRSRARNKIAGLNADIVTIAPIMLVVTCFTFIISSHSLHQFHIHHGQPSTALTQLFYSYYLTDALHSTR